MNYWPLLGIAVVVLGFVLRLNPIAVVVAAGLASGLLAGKPLGELLALLGDSFVSNRALMLFVLTLPTIGLLERAGLREHMHAWILRMRRMTFARLLLGYLALRQLLSMAGLTNAGGHAQTVRPLLAPMSEAAAEKEAGPLPPELRQRVLALDAATDNVGLFFGEDVFVAVGAVLGVIMLRLRNQETSTPIPFGPYLAIAGWIALLWGDQITATYLQFAGFR